MQIQTTRLSHEVLKTTTILTKKYGSTAVHIRGDVDCNYELYAAESKDSIYASTQVNLWNQNGYQAWATNFGSR